MEDRTPKQTEATDLETKSTKAEGNETRKINRRKQTKTEARERAAFLKERATAHKRTVEEAKTANALAGKEGDVCVAKLPHYRSRDGGEKTWPNKPGKIESINSRCF